MLVERGREYGILNPKDLLSPVRSSVTGHDPVFMHDSGAKPTNRDDFVSTARSGIAGMYNNAGHFLG